jgi:hypothetical protein
MRSIGRVEHFFAVYKDLEGAPQALEASAERE